MVVRGFLSAWLTERRPAGDQPLDLAGDLLLIITDTTVCCIVIGAISSLVLFA